MIWILVNFSADDDSRVLEELTQPHYQFLYHLNRCLQVYSSESCFDDLIVQNLIWIFGNLIGEQKAEYFNAILENTDILAFFHSLLSWQQPIPSNIMQIMPWTINNMTMMRPQSADIIDLLLRVLSLIGKQVAMYIQSQTK